MLAVIESIQSRAVREGGGPRSLALYGLAGHVFERLWRLEAHEHDAEEATNLYRIASRDLAAEGACDAALAAARLAGDFARDPAIAYAELYRTDRRLGSSKPGPSDALAPCRRSVEDALALLVAFRPGDAVLATIEQVVAELAAGSTAGLDGSSAADRSQRPIASERVSGQPRIVRVESWPGRDSTRVVVVVDRPAAFRVVDEPPSSGTAPSIAVDLDGTDVGNAPEDISLQGLVTHVRATPIATGARVRLDLDGHAWRRVFEMREPFRVVVDVARRPPGGRGGGRRTVARVVLDPGHGGSDQGARGPGGLEEKDVALDIVQRVAPTLIAQGIEVALTREDDRFVSLEERTARANGFGADLFVSVHCNASEGRARRGVETYVLDTSRDEIEARVAARENATTQLARGDLASILSEIRLADGVRRSRRLAELLLRTSTTSLEARYGDATDGGVHAAGFYVLVGARMPAVLFETGYISNAIDEQRFATAEYRQLFADAIANALRAYREGR
jgi:N-acetylmuramoyl-L-alanine amidase